MRKIRATLPGIAERPHRAGGVIERDWIPALRGPELELGHHRPAELAELDGLGAELDFRVDPAEVEQVGRQPAEPPRLRPRALEQGRASSRSGVPD